MFFGEKMPKNGVKKNFSNFFCRYKLPYAMAQIYVKKKFKKIFKKIPPGDFEIFCFFPEFS